MLDIRKFRRIQTIVSIAIFLLVFFACWFFTEFNIKDIQLSYWGVDNKVWWLWNSCLAILSISMFFNVYHFIDWHPRAHFKKFSKILFIITFLSLFLTGIVDMHHKLHNITAFFYFFSYPLAIFIFAHLNRKLLQYKEWLTHTAVAVVMTLIPLILIQLFHGMAIAETAHGIIAASWNLWILLED